jgi:hypothetical protein
MEYSGEATPLNRFFVRSFADMPRPGPSCYHALFCMLSPSDFQRLKAAEASLQRGDYCLCFNELKRIDNRDDTRVDALWWRLYSDSGLHAAAADVALAIQRRHSKELSWSVWHSHSFGQIGCYRNTEAS